MAQQARTNRLAGETSPYLLQHAHNPVEWYPWGEEALARARAEHKPVLLSIGYSACHWCHVMAHECFEDPEVAGVMNRLFVNIKVDREERPDLDRIYQHAFQLLNRRGGGWPLTMFLTHDDQVPFFGATYVPREPRHGLPGFADLMERLAAFYRDHEAELRRQNRSLLQALSASLAPREGGPPGLDAGPLEAARDALVASFDAVHGGFGSAPKFPTPTALERLLRHQATWCIENTPDEEARHALLHTLRRMAGGGLHDHLGGGFYRYSVDGQWMIPHFEKMLYDNGPLLALYARAWQATGETLFRRAAGDTADWVMTEMQAPGGGYYSSLDADSEGEEGRFYVWDREEVRGLLDAESYPLFAARFGLDGEPNFEGRWHLHAHRSVEAVAAAAGLDGDRARALLDDATARLLQARERRVRPGRDEKVLTAWNGLMIKGMAAAGRHLGRPECIDSAERALDFLRREVWREGRLLASWKDGRARHPAYLDDYAFLADGVLELLQARWRNGDLNFALALVEVLLERFQDPDGGGFYFTADDHEALIQRPKPFFDESLPSGNGIAARVLLELGHLTGNPHYLQAAEGTLRGAWPVMTQAPAACNALLDALEEHLQPGQCVVIRGPVEAMMPWHGRAAPPCAPRRLTLAIPADAPGLPGALAAREPGEGVKAYVCTGSECSAPVERLEALEVELRRAEWRPSESGR